MIDDLLHELGARLRTSPRTRARILEEAREHLEDAAERFVQEGAAPDVARRRAVAAFGDPALVAREFNAEAATTLMRWTPVAILVYAVIVVGGFLGAAVPVPQPQHATSASIALRVAFFVGTLGVQIAFVAGVRAASIVVARSRDAVAPGRERRIVRNAALVGGAGLAVAACAWSVTFLLVRAGGGLSGDRTLVAGAIGLALASVGGMLATVWFATRAIDDDDSDAPLPARFASLGERATRLVVDYPRTACAVVAITAGALTMRGAEATALGALPSGVAEVVSVVAAFLVLGPRLGLRDGSATRA